MKNLLLVVMPFFLMSCAGNKEKTEMKNPLEVLNGANYGQSAAPVYGNDQGITTMSQGIPATGTQNRATRVRGKILLGEGFNAAPLKFVEVRVTDAAGKKLAQVTSDINGKFSFSGVFFNGRYFIEIISKKYTGKAEFFVDRYEVEVEVNAKPL